MKKIITIFAAFALLTGCDFLEEENYNALGLEDVLNSPANTEKFVTGLYSELQNAANNLCITGEVPTDYVCIAPTRKNAAETRWHNGLFAYSDAFPSNVWNNLYGLIYKCNIVLDNVDQVAMDDPTLRERYKAEARLLRGWAYLILTNYFKDIPLRTTSEYKRNYSLAKSSSDVIYDFLIGDLEFAEQNLYSFLFGRAQTDLEALGDKGFYTDAERMRAGVDTAIGLQALAYLYRAGNDPASPYWVLARDKAKQLIDRSGGLSGAKNWLSPTYYGLYRGANKWHRENLLSIYFKGGKGEGSTMANNWSVFSTLSKAAANGYRRFTNIWYNKHFQGHYDLRNAEGLSHEFANPAGTPFFWPSPKNTFIAEVGKDPTADYAGATAAWAGPWCDKYSDKEAVTPGACEPGLNLLRYAEVLLIFAEAENEVNGPTADAYEALNAVRARAMDYPQNAAYDWHAPNGMTEEQFRTFVLEERERELFGEGKHLLDLNRREMWGTKVSATQYDAVESSGAVEFDGYNRIRTASKLIFAIPKSEIDANHLIGL